MSRRSVPRMAQRPVASSRPESEQMDLAVEYNNRSRVPDHPRVIDGWAASAESHRARVRGELDLAYGARRRNRVDVFPSQSGDGQGPLVVFLHGGYWVALDKSWFSHVAAGANALGLDLAVPSYSLCPEVSIPDIIEEMRQCCLFLARRYGRRLLLTGHSAGGHLSACMAATDWEAYGARADLIQGCLSISGLFDLRPLIAVPINASLRLNAVDAAVASPLLWPMPYRMPVDSWVGGQESAEFLRQAAALPAAWQGLGVPCRYEVLAADNHFTLVDHLADPAHPMTRRLAEMAAQ